MTHATDDLSIFLDAPPRPAARTPQETLRRGYAFDDRVRRAAVARLTHAILDPESSERLWMRAIQLLVRIDQLTVATNKPTKTTQVNVQVGIVNGANDEQKARLAAVKLRLEAEDL